MSHEAVSQQQFGEHLGHELAHEMQLHPALGGTRVNAVAYRGVAKHIMQRANIRQTPPLPQEPGDPPEWEGHYLEEAPHVLHGYHDEPQPGYRPHHEELWTSQSHLHMPTLAKYARGDIPEHDPDYGEEHVPYQPETYEHEGKRWIYEGHHRTIATRLAW